MSLSWKQLVLCGAAVLATGAIGYRLLSASKCGAEDSGKADQVATGKKKRRPKTRPKSKEAPKGIESVLPNGIEEMMNECDLPVPELLQMSPEDKQRLFYALLMKGEMLMSKGPKEMQKSLDYFAKAVAIVPNPGEVVAAFEKTLPPPIFNALLDKIQRDIQVKVGEYFKGLLPEESKSKFIETTVKEPGMDHPARVWLPVASSNLAVGTTVWEESADVVALNVNVENIEDYCEHCLKNLEGETRVECPACERQLYCSQACQIKSAEVCHVYFCKAPTAVEEAIQDLLTICKENQTSLALLVLRYVAFLLSEELRGNGAANNGPFAHYDHLKPVFKAPNDTDRAEARLLRQIYSSTNQNIVEFLSDEIYASMKHTIARTLVASVTDSSLSHMECRNVDDSLQSLSFFHVSAHLAHSCDPNTMIIRPTPGTARVAALKNISSGEKLSVSYLPFADGTTTAERQLHLMRVFGIHCECNLCAEDLPIIA